MQWSDVINDPQLRNLPFKVELDRWGRVLMSPASNRHGGLQFEVGSAIDRARRGGKVIMECSIQTDEGVRVADVAWASDAFIARHGWATPYPQAPEVCVEIISPSNSQGEIDEKVRLYLARGAGEVWLVDEAGKTLIRTRDGLLPASRALPGADAKLTER